MSQEGVYRCENCGAPLEVTPETIVAVCEYCGHPNWIVKDAMFAISMVPSVSRETIIKSFWNRVNRDFDLSRIKDQISIREVRGFYAPYWFALAEARAHYEGYRRETYTDSEGHVHTRRVHVSGNVSVSRFIGVIGRRAVEDMAIDELGAHYAETRPEDVPLESVEWDRVKLPVLSTEYGEKDARSLILEEIWNHAKRQAESKVDELEVFRCQAWLKTNPRMILLPYWIVVYSYKGGSYRTAFAGWDSKPLEATEPVMAYHRAGYYVGSLLGAAIAGGGAAYGVANGSMGALIFGAVVGFIMSFVFGRKLISDVRVEKG